MLEELQQKPKDKITREELKALLVSLGEPGENQEAKREAIASLGIKNFQGIKLEDTLYGWKEM